MIEINESTKVAHVVTGDGVRKVAERIRLRAYLTRAKTGMNLTRAFIPTVRSFNADYGTSCKTWADVLTEAERMLKEGE